ncbi:MAG: hypothetical protein V4519_05280 [Patescibacteria group bacterium]
MKPEELKASLGALGITGLALDIDETLSHTSKIWIADMHKSFGSREGLTAEEMVQKYRYPNDVPYWLEQEHLDWMNRTMGSDEINESLPIIENAHSVVQRINTIVPIVAYITARPESVRESTKRWLTKHNFPEAPVILRPPEFHIRDANKWKAGVLHYLYPQVQGIIDDNQKLERDMTPDYKGTIYLYNLNSCNRTDINVVCCPTWEDAYESIKKSR